LKSRGASALAKVALRDPTKQWATYTKPFTPGDERILKRSKDTSTADKDGGCHECDRCKRPSERGRQGSNKPGCEFLQDRTSIFLHWPLRLPFYAGARCRRERRGAPLIRTRRDGIKFSSQASPPDGNRSLARPNRAHAVTRPPRGNQKARFRLFLVCNIETSNIQSSKASSAVFGSGRCPLKA
jgi:hypothetical protein